ncbi:MAG: polyribonucleotide nucleotidyltransferase [Pedosphaera sp.]|nr:polyribonucleotide nucleotidyltransferase [Pedosphaera sp.]
MSHKVTANVGGAEIHIESGKIAKQADGSVTVQLGDTIVLVAACGSSKPRPGLDFFPLTVDYREKAAAAGRFPGGFFKREGRPSEKEILTCRVTDRPIRPLFPKGYFNEVQIQTLLLSADGENDSDILSINGASAALMISDLPFAGPIGAVRVGRVGGEFVANPTHEQMELSDLDLVYVGNESNMVMFEGSADEIPEADFLEALKFGQDSIAPLIAAQKELCAAVGKAKREFTPRVVEPDVQEEAEEIISGRITDALLIQAKLEREAACNALKDEMEEKLIEKFGDENITGFIVGEAFYSIQKAAVRKLVLDDGKRLDGRGFDDMRQLISEAGMIPRTHGSGLFARGETQGLSLVTLGTTDDTQSYDAYTGGPNEKRFMLHYNFPNFSVGETGRIMGPGRREIGHGALAERSIAPVIPNIEDFPYAVRITAEIMESNGSTSMAAVCSGTLALLDAGVPLKRSVAGISIGLCTRTNDNKEIEAYKLLTDIIGWEDAFCDMDCKIAGTDQGITGFQLDLKLHGIPQSIMEEAIAKAKTARTEILANMGGCLAKEREEMSPYAPRIVTIPIDPSKIGELIGPGGKNIKRIVEESGCEINIEDDGRVLVYSMSAEGLQVAKDCIEGITAEVEVGKLYRGKVVSIKDFGCFVEVLPGKDGLVHISELANFRVKKTEDIVKDGDEIWVKCIGVDDKGRVKLSRKAAMEERKAEFSDDEEGGEGPDTNDDSEE